MKKSVELNELADHIGWYVSLLRKGSCEVGKIEEVDPKESKMIYRVVYGENKGKRFRSTYHLPQPVDVCDYEDLEDLIEKARKGNEIGFQDGEYYLKKDHERGVADADSKNS